MILLWLTGDQLNGFNQFLPLWVEGQNAKGLTLCHVDRSAAVHMQMQ